MEKVINFLKEKGYSNIYSSYYSKIKEWKEIWKGKAPWLNLKTIDGKDYPMYSLNIGNKGCEDLSSIITSESFDLKASKSNNLLQKLIKEAKVISKLPDDIEMMGYSGTVASVTRIKNASVVEENGMLMLKANEKTKRVTINVDALHIIPLTIEDGEIINCAFISEEKRKIGNEIVKVWYIELHELEEKGYQISNIYIRDDDGAEIQTEGILKTYNTLSNIPLFTILRLPKKNIFDENNGLGMALFANAIDQMMIVDLAYNNFGTDFKLGGKLVIYNKKLTRVVSEEYKDKDGNIQYNHKVLYPTDIQKQQFMEIGDGISTGNEQPFIHEYNPDLRVGDNKEGTQFALDCFSFRIGFGNHYYSFENGTVNTATEAILSNKDLVNNARKIRKAVNEYLVGICRSLLLSERILGNNKIDVNCNIEIPDVDGFLEDDETKEQKAQTEVSMGLMSKRTYLIKYKNYTEKEADKELQSIEDEDDYDIDMDNDDDINPDKEE